MQQQKSKKQQKLARIKRISKRNKKVSKNKTKQIGGALVVSEQDLKNTHLCDVKLGKYKETPGYELYSAIATSFQLNHDSTGFLINNYKKKDGKWFKFVIFNNDGISYLYIISGAPINKHSVCVLEGILDVTKGTAEYSNIRTAYNALNEEKSVNGSKNGSEENSLVKNLNTAINESIPCMPVISAGSGTVNDDGSICINTKSGHYKPGVQEMDIAKHLFETITGRQINVSTKADKALLLEKYGNEYSKFSGICL
jgi:hypothetical protein